MSPSAGNRCVEKRGLVRIALVGANNPAFRNDLRVVRRPVAGFESGAFTLLELLVVIAIVAILGGIVFGFGHRATEIGRAARARAELATISLALESYRKIHGDYPRTNSPALLLQSLIGQRAPDGQPITGRVLIEAARFTTAAALDPFTNATAELIDPWGQPYRYAYKSESSWMNSSYVLYSAGPDGSDTSMLKPGGFPNPDGACNADNLWANP
ncbi:MAG TPA: type II secretion system protein GspG [Lacunisphaera sp.]|nr:type II secretion system protein GspG [Lacunisphaera sp.]